MNPGAYSAISVLDRLRLEEQYAELLSGWYDDNAEEGMDLGHLAPTGYIMGGNITKTSAGFTLQISITKSTDKMTIASYSNTITSADLDNLSGVRRASLDLLQKMGVVPTEQTRIALSGAAAINDVNSQRALSRGIVAQQGGNEYEAILNYFEARTFNVTMPEASARITNASTTLAANNWINTGLRDQVLSEIERMKEEDRLQRERDINIHKLLKKATAFYKSHQPFFISIGPNFTYSNIDHRKRTVDIDASMRIDPIDSEMKIIKSIEQQAKSIGINNWPYYAKMGSAGSRVFYGFLTAGMSAFFDVRDAIEISRYNTVPGIWKFTAGRSAVEQYSEYGDFGFHMDIITINEPSFNVVVKLINEKGKVLGTQSILFKTETMNIAAFSSSAKISFTIDADYLTDIMIMQIISVNGNSVSSDYVVIEHESVRLTSMQR